MLDRLMAADSLDASVTEPAWRGFVEYVAETLDVGPGMRIFQVNCRAGSFLCPLWENGYVVGGLDPSPDQIRIAAEAMPEGQFTALALSIRSKQDWNCNCVFDGFLFSSS